VAIRETKAVAAKAVFSIGRLLVVPAFAIEQPAYQLALEWDRGLTVWSFPTEPEPHLEP
jgi:hypothetical protein